MTDEFELIDYNKKQLMISSDEEQNCVWFQWTDHENDISFKFSPEDAYRIGRLLLEKAKILGIGNE